MLLSLSASKVSDACSFRVFEFVDSIFNLFCRDLTRVVAIQSIFDLSFKFEIFFPPPPPPASFSATPSWPEQLLATFSNVSSPEKDL